jgi:hypothetical protein
LKIEEDENENPKGSGEHPQVLLVIIRKMNLAFSKSGNFMFFHSYNFSFCEKEVVKD